MTAEPSASSPDNDGQRTGRIPLTRLGPFEADHLRDLFEVLVAALKLEPPAYIQSIFGPARTWLPPYRRSSELGVLDVWRPVQSLHYLMSISVPAFSHGPGRLARALLPVPVQRLFWRASCYFQQPDPFQSVTSFPDERWFFINGVATTPAVAKRNTELLSEMFHRPITGIYNATNSLLLDLIECALDKRVKLDPDLNDLATMTAPTCTATRAILSTLQEDRVKRLVVIAHSQGTIIAANVLRAVTGALRLAEAETETAAVGRDASEAALARLAYRCMLPQAGQCSRQEKKSQLLAQMKKLEFYLFANCADQMSYLAPELVEGHEGLPFMENFANEKDLVARLGILSPLRHRTPPKLNLAGPLYLAKETWGHFFNAHHLQAIHDHLKAPDSVANPYPPAEAGIPEQPRLYQYFAGARPDRSPARTPARASVKPADTAPASARSRRSGIFADA